MKKKDEKVEEKKMSKIKFLFLIYKSSPGFKALVKLFSYFILFFIIILVVSLAGPYDDVTKDAPQNKTEEVRESKSYKEILSDTLSNHKKVKYQINLNEVSYLLSYEIVDNTLNGILETYAGITKFTLHDDVIYEVKLNEELPNNELFSFFNNDYWNVYSLINLLSNNKAMKMLKDNETIYKYTIEDNEFVVSVALEQIKKIEISGDNVNYIVTFE